MYYFLGALLLGTMFMDKPQWAIVITLFILVTVVEQHLRSLNDNLNDLERTIKDRSEDICKSVLRTCSICGAPDATRLEDETDLLCPACRQDQP